MAEKPSNKIISFNEYRYRNRLLRVNRYSPNKIGTMTLANEEGETLVFDPVALLKQGVSIADYLLAHDFSMDAQGAMLQHYYSSVVNYYSFLERQRTIRSLTLQMAALQEEGGTRYVEMADVANRIDKQRNRVTEIVTGKYYHELDIPTFYHPRDFIKFYELEAAKADLRLLRAKRRSRLENRSKNRDHLILQVEGAIKSKVRLFPPQHQEMLLQYTQFNDDILLSADDFWLDTQGNEDENSNTIS